MIFGAKYQPGIYFAIISNGNYKKQVIKLIKR
jgi:hypothetical protein